MKCPVCGQSNMDFHAVTYRTHPFIDGRTYPRMCFGCAHVPEEYQQKYDEQGECVDQLGPFFDHKHLLTAQELYEQGSVDSLAEARRCIAGVRARLKEVGAVKLKKLRLKRPQHEYDSLDETPSKPVKKATKRKKAVKPTKPTKKKKAVRPTKKKKFGASKPKV